jgi:hypothetical protein
MCMRHFQVGVAHGMVFRKSVILIDGNTDCSNRLRIFSPHEKRKLVHTTMTNLEITKDIKSKLDAEYTSYYHSSIDHSNA